MRVPALALAAALLLAVAPVSAAGAASSAPLAEAAAKKKCKKGYVLRTVKKTKRINGKVRTVKVKRCVKKRRTVQAGQRPQPPQPPAPPAAAEQLPQPPAPPAAAEQLPQPQAPPVDAGCPSPYTGRATGMDGVFQYGDVRVDRTCGEVTRVEIKSVSSQCNTGSFTFIVVFNPSSPDIGILEGSNQIVGDKMHVVYQPDKTSANQTTMDITFAGNTAQGEFHSIGNCKQDGLFTATAG